MSILVVWASPNQDGLTSAAKDNILKGLSEAGGEAEALHLNKRDIRCCRACGNGWGLCRSEGRCVINDDFSEDYQRLVSAEAIVRLLARSCREPEGFSGSPAPVRDAP